MEQLTRANFSFKGLFLPFTNAKAIIIITVVGFIVYANSLFNGFVWDDLGYIVYNTEINAINLPSLFGKSMFNSFGYYRPLSATYFSLLYLLFQQHAFFYHLIQLIIHIVNTSLLFLLFTKFFRKELSLFLSIIFLIHPIQVESVAFISASQSALFFLFGITALLISIKNVLEQKYLLSISILLLLSLLTKETGFLFLTMVIIYRKFFNKKRILYFLPFFITPFIIYLFIRLTVAEIFIEKIELMPIGRLSLVERLINIPQVIFYYLKTFIFPQILLIDQQWVVKKIDFTNFYFPLLIDLLFFGIIAILGAYLLKINKKAFQVLLYFFLWFLVGIALHLQIFPLDMTVADRWFYFPMVGLLGTLGIGIYSINAFYRRDTKVIGYLSAFLVVILLSTRTMIRNANWADGLTLYMHDSKIQTNYDIESNLATELTFKLRYNEAIEHYLKSIDMYPNEIAISNLAHAYEKVNNIAKAKEYYKKIISGEYNILPAKFHERILSDAYERLAWLSIMSDRPEESRIIIKKALQIYPNSGSLWANLAIIEYKLQNRDGALSAAKKAQSLLPKDSPAQLLYTQILNNKPLELK